MMPVVALDAAEDRRRHVLLGADEALLEAKAVAEPRP
jgi:hypothetical protein